jgi:hypothetical protein
MLRGPSANLAFESAERLAADRAVTLTSKEDTDRRQYAAASRRTLLGNDEHK